MFMLVISVGGIAVFVIYNLVRLCRAAWKNYKEKKQYG